MLIGSQCDVTFGTVRSCLNTSLPATADPQPNALSVDPINVCLCEKAKKALISFTSKLYTLENREARGEL